ncbi:MAG: DEAD/DEAH box helicase, partial [Deltaproteobacteria bacterium]|nr:DEAD/DEAH box helicase [Deltaproteobacteria bacterium]
LYSLDLVRAQKGVDENLLRLQHVLTGSPHIQTIANIEALLHAIMDTAPPDAPPDKPLPVFHFSATKEDWRLVLYNISQIGQKAQAQGEDAPQVKSERLIYRVSYEDWNESYRVSPFIQKETRNGGWSKGKIFHPRWRLDGKVDTGFFSPTDDRVLSLLDAEQERSERRRYSDWYQENHNEALYELAGHPYLFMESEKPVPMEIETASPQVEVVAVNDDIEIRMYPSTPCDKGYCVEKRGANRLRVTRFTKSQLALLEALGENGVRFPQTARNEIAEAIGHIGALSEVHSHVPDVGLKSVDMLASDTLLIRMQPFVNGLSAQFLVTPLGQSGPAFVPGHGPDQVFATVAGEKRTATRDLSKESSRLDQLLMALGLYYTDESGDGLYHFAEEAGAIEFLSELENCKSNADAPGFEVEWPKGAALKCSRTLFPKDFNLLINKKRKWLQVGGTLTVSDREIYDLAALVGAQETPKAGFIRLTNGAFLRLSKSLKKFLSHLSGLGEAGEDGLLQAPENAAISVMKLADEAGEITVNAAWEKTVAGIDQSLKLESKVPRQVKATLRDYQLEGFRWLHRLSTLGMGACLADDMGLGKTLQTLTLLQLRCASPKLKKPSLVVAPVSVIPGWIEEARRFVPGLQMIQYTGADRRQIREALKPRQVLVTSYGLLQRDGASLAKIAFDMIVLDEAQFIKNKDAARAKAAFKLQGDFKMVTTGTPVENRLSEFWSIFNFINPGLLGSHKAFQQTYEKGIQLFGDSMALDALRFQVKPFLLRRTKEETLDELPPKTEIVRYCEMSKEEAAFYELRRRQAQNMLRLSDSKSQMMELITALTTLRQAACHPRLIEPELQIDSAKLNCLKDILTELKEGGHQALIFSQFVKFLSIVRTWLDEQGITYQYLDGSSTPKQRTAAVTAFQAGKSDLFLISMRAGGFGLNLTAADYVVHLDPWWNPAVEDQASDRVHRIGQTRPVTIYKIVTRGTIEEKVLQIHGDKRDLASGLLEGSDAVAKLDMKELIALI